MAFESVTEVSSSATQQTTRKILLQFHMYSSHSWEITPNFHKTKSCSIAKYYKVTLNTLFQIKWRDQILSVQITL